VPRLASALAHSQSSRPVWLTRAQRVRRRNWQHDGSHAPAHRPGNRVGFGCIVIVLLVGSLYSTSFLSPEYLLQQLKVASFLGVIATGMMIVILLGQIDLSVPWVLRSAG